MTKRAILTINEARYLQPLDNAEPPRPWPAEYENRLLIDTPELPHQTYDDARIQLANCMIGQGCTVEHIKEQMNWKAAGTIVKALFKLHKMRTSTP